MFVNTSISALDSNEQIEYRLYQYNRLKTYCNSVLRVNTADFIDERLKKRQTELINNEQVIDNILRIPKNHHLVINKIVNVEKHEFLNGKVWASKFNKNTYFGHCDDCLEKCGLTMFK